MAADTLTAEQIIERIRSDGLRKALVAFRRPPVPSRLLQELVELPDCPEARQFVAAYPLSPGHLLEALVASETEPSIVRHLAGNPRTPPHLLSQLASHPDVGVRIEAAQHPQLPPRELLSLGRDPEPRVRCALSGNPSLRLPDQALLADDEEPSVRLSLVGHSALSPQAALALASDSSAVVRVHAVAAARVEEELLHCWAAADEEELLLALLRREELPEKLWKRLLLSPHASVRRQARGQLKPDETDLYFLVTRGEAEERAWVAGLSPLSRPLQSLLARDQEPSVRVALASNPSLEAAVARYFLGLAEEATCQALASNPVVSKELMQELAATRLPEVLRTLAYRDDLEPALVRALVSLSPDFCRHWAKRGRPVSGLELETARRLLENPLPCVRVLGVSGHAWRRADLYDLARDPAPEVRIAALRHANVPEELLNDWTKDAEPEVARVALERLVDLRNQRQSLQNFAANLSRPQRSQTVGEGRATMGAVQPASQQPSPSREGAAPLSASRQEELRQAGAGRQPKADASQPAAGSVSSGLQSGQPAEGSFRQAAQGPASSLSDSDPGLLNKLKRIFFWQ